MGRGISPQQRTILAIAAAVNAGRRGGKPEQAVLEIDIAKGTDLGPGVYAGQRFTARTRSVLSVDPPDLFDNFLLVVIAEYRVQNGSRTHIEPTMRVEPLGMREQRERKARGAPPREKKFHVVEHTRYFRRRWDPSSVCHSKRVSVERAVKALAARGLLATCPSLVWFRGERGGQAVMDAMPNETRKYWARVRKSTSYFITAAGIDATGDEYQHLDLDQLMSQWDEATGMG